MSKSWIVFSLLCNPPAISTLGNILIGKQIHVVEKIDEENTESNTFAFAPYSAKSKPFFSCCHVALHYSVDALDEECFLPSYHYTFIGF